MRSSWSASHSCVTTGAVSWVFGWWPNTQSDFAGLVAANTALPTGDKEISDAFLAWQNQSQELALPVGEIVSRGCVNPLPDEVITAYEAPFPEERYKEGMKQLPLLIPVWPDDPAAGANRLAWETLAELDIPFLCAFSDSDPITRNIDKAFMRSIKGPRTSRTRRSKEPATSSRRTTGRIWLLP